MLWLELDTCDGEIITATRYLKIGRFGGFVLSAVPSRGYTTDLKSSLREKTLRWVLDKTKKVHDKLAKCQNKHYLATGCEIIRLSEAATKELQQLDDQILTTESNGMKTLGARALFSLCSACRDCEPISLNEDKPSTLACLVPVATLGDARRVIFFGTSHKGAAE